MAGVRSLFFVGTAGVLSDGHKLERVWRKDVATSRLESPSLVAIRLLALLCQHTAPLTVMTQGGVGALEAALGGAGAPELSLGGQGALEAALGGAGAPELSLGGQGALWA